MHVVAIGVIARTIDALFIYLYRVKGVAPQL
jgi:hypothetical protein